ncbi:hypothetical protein AL038_18930 [Beggiatoa leptomitoformis]|uniref:Uncharacterized protein n=1 Tax=Beggiatoa leptomitoformis TaxID=288004 RepID=A0A650GDT9_9GAMM|nr:hypothetical protein AL038_18930 [Beggiatoa leptomitoformis]QGX04086.1 hypothetical protein BLE401_18625 [Beggiatoa leptomitoformis]
MQVATEEEWLLAIRRGNGELRGYSEEGFLRFYDRLIGRFLIPFTLCLFAQMSGNYRVICKPAKGICRCYLRRNVSVRR